MADGIEKSITSVPVAELNKEWAAGEDSGDDENTVDKQERPFVDSFSARERRITEGVEVLNEQPIIGDVDVEVIAETEDWQGAVNVDPEDSPDQIDKHMTEVFEARERRLKTASEELEKQQIIGDTDVEVITETQEWSGSLHADVEDGDEKFDHYASAVYEAREQRLSKVTEELQKEQMIGDTDVEVIVESKDWAGVDGFGEEEEATDPNGHAAEMFEDRERRLSSGAEVSEKELPMGDADVEVIKENQDWAGAAEAEEEQDDVTDFDQHAAEVFEVRERRLTSTEEVLAKEVIIGDRDVEVVAESKEWAGIPEEDACEDEDPAGRSFEQYASEMYEVRERRLTVGAEILQTENADDGLENSAPVPTSSADDSAHNEETVDACIPVAPETAQGPAIPEDVAAATVEESTEQSTPATVPQDAEATKQQSDAEATQEETLAVDADFRTDPDPVSAPKAAEAEESTELPTPATVPQDAEATKQQSDAEAAKKETPAADADFRTDPDPVTAPKAAEAEEKVTQAPASTFDPPPRNATNLKPKEATPAAEADADEEGSEWETDEESDDEIFNRANPDAGLRRREKADPWKDMFKWIAAVIAVRMSAEGGEVKTLRSLIGDGLDAAALTPESLCDGKILCALIIALRPEALRKPIPNAMGRLSQVQKACKQFGVRETDLFGPPDILNAPPQNPNAVLRCLTAVAGIVQSEEEYSGPKLRKRP